MNETNTFDNSNIKLLLDRYSSYKYSVYMLLCEDGSIYTGYTTDVLARYNKHCLGIGAKYTRSHKPVGILYTEGFETKSEAMKRECAIKRMTHQEKVNLAVAHTSKSQFYQSFIQSKVGTSQ